MTLGWTSVATSFTPLERTLTGEGEEDYCSVVWYSSLTVPPPLRLAIGDSCRSFKELFVEIRERASKALGFAKMLRKVGWYTRVNYSEL